MFVFGVFFSSIFSLKESGYLIDKNCYGTIRKVTNVGELKRMHRLTILGCLIEEFEELSLEEREY